MRSEKRKTTLKKRETCLVSSPTYERAAGTTNLTIIVTSVNGVFIAESGGRVEEGIRRRRMRTSRRLQGTGDDNDDTKTWTTDYEVWSNTGINQGAIEAANCLGDIVFEEILTNHLFSEFGVPIVVERVEVQSFVDTRIYCCHSPEARVNPARNAGWRFTMAAKAFLNNSISKGRR